MLDTMTTMDDSISIDYNVDVDGQVPPTKIQPKSFGSSFGMIQVDLETDDEDGNHEDPQYSGQDIMSRFFDTWDEDESGFLDVEEVLQGVEKLCDSMHLDYDSRRISALLEELDSDGNQELDRNKFSFFLRKYADLNDIGMEDLAFVMATDEQMASSQPIATSRRHTRNPTLFFNNLFSAMALKRDDDVKRAATADKSSTGEETTKKPPQQSLASFFNRFGGEKREEEEDTVTDTTAGDDATNKQNEDDSEDEIKSMLWNISTSDINIFAEAGLTKDYERRGGY